jgi:cell wall-associated NlpC family hydrolase
MSNIFFKLVVNISRPDPASIENGVDFIKYKWIYSQIFYAFSFILLAGACGGNAKVSSGLPTKVSRKKLALMGYSVQIGAFSNLNNAIRLTRSLEKSGLEAYYFVHPTRLYKVRFGDFPTRESARKVAERIRVAGIIDNYYIVSPKSYAVSKRRRQDRRSLRDDLVDTAESFIGLPYRWGGSSPKYGFDCSGLTMAVYQLNGLKLPRSSREQYRDGTPIRRNRLKKGDLVFFSTVKSKRISHVGIYKGDEKFIHAPGRGKRIRFDSLKNKYFNARYMGARTYLR